MPRRHACNEKKMLGGQLPTLAMTPIDGAASSHDNLTPYTGGDASHHAIKVYGDAEHQTGTHGAGGIIATTKGGSRRYRSRGGTLGRVLVPAALVMANNIIGSRRRSRRGRKSRRGRQTRRR